MKFSLLAITTFASIASAAPFNDENPGFVKAQLTKREFKDPSVSQLFRRGQINTPLYNQVSYYQIELEVGNPPQKLQALLDTGSSDMWFFSNYVGAGNAATFSPQRSNTWHNNYTQFTISYVSGSAQGTWGTDEVSISGSKIKGQSFAIVTSGNGLTGIPGLIGTGLPALESTNNNFNFFQPRHTYSNVPLSLFEQGHIGTPTYSLYLDTIDAKAGTVLFGAIDHSKYKGKMYSVPRVHNSRFNINIDDIQVNGNSVGSTSSATLDSGTTLGSLPDSVISGLVSSLGLQQDYSNNGIYYARRNSFRGDTPVTFSISGVKFNIKASDLFIDSEKLGDPFPAGLSILGFSPASQTQGQVILGDVFLRNFYIVYDLSNPQLGIALANFNHTSVPQFDPITTSVIPRSQVVAATKLDTTQPVQNTQANPFARLFGPFRGLFGNGLFGNNLFGNSLLSPKQAATVQEKLDTPESDASTEEAIRMVKKSIEDQLLVFDQN
ncbi:uncharacterized protein SAPINGB_P001521 [Magnusiomyces paraingens]|uniref:Peptidase A1 domain-containing protein n=1 Tax=Magnusiomyces paraingens TaxID=2606893 RepID=A0A5E8B6D5_9ASCO|nr:uncharacterized protein SAPINGB_P001521 [Saprochaete ingens]VVT47055.1 unnamed protein product [Saprochaete ingens]